MSTGFAQPTAQGPEEAFGAQSDQSTQAVARTRTISRAPDGSFVAVWHRSEFTGTPFEQPGIFAQRYDADGNRIGDEFRVSDDGTGFPNPFSTSPAVAHTQSGEFVVVWQGQTAANPTGPQQILARRLDSDGDPVAAIFQVNESDVANVAGGRGPDIVAMDDGAFVVVWTGRYAEQYTSQIMGQRLDSEGAKVGSEFVANTFTLGYAYDPQIGSRGDGSFVVVWTARPSEYGSPPGGSGADVFGQRFNGTGTKTGTEFLVNTFTDYPENQPDIAVRSDGSFVVVWHTVYGDDETFDDSISMQLFNSSGVPVGEEEHINTYVTGNQRQPSIAMNDDGTFVVVWESADTYFASDNRDDGAGIFGLCFNANGVNPGSDFHVNSYTPGRERYPSIATDGAGEFVVAWERSVGTYGGDGDAYLRRFDIPSCEGNGSTTTTTLPSGGNLQIEKTDNSQFWSDDSTIVYDLTVTREGGDSGDVVVQETVPAQTVFAAAESSPGWSCAGDGAAGDICTLNVSGLGDGEDRVVQFAVTVDGGTPLTWIVYNQAIVAESDAAEIIESGAALTASADEELPAGEETTESSDCTGALFDFTVCDFCCYLIDYVFQGSLGCGTVPAIVDAASVAADAIGSTISSIEDFSTMFRIRDRVLPDSRGGERFIDLYYEHGPAMTEAAAGDSQIFADAASALGELMPAFDALDEGSGSSVTVTQAGVDAMNTFLDRVATSASPDLAAAIARERARLDVDAWAGMTADEALEQLDLLSCQGFEDTLYCGEVTGDCRITASDALRVLTIAVGSQPTRDEADLDGNGSVSATDALITLNIAVGLLGDVTDCNPA